MTRASICIPRILKHEGGFVNDPRDAGGATNRGVTIGTLRSLGMDIDGDGDIDVADVRALTEPQAVIIYKQFYWDAVQADLLPAGVDYAVADFAVNSGPRRAAEHLQRALGLRADGVIGPRTLAAASKADRRATINLICDSRLAFMRSIRGGRDWAAFGKGWTRRVEETRALALQDARP